MTVTYCIKAISNLRKKEAFFNLLESAQCISGNYRMRSPLHCLCLYFFRFLSTKTLRSKPTTSLASLLRERTSIRMCPLTIYHSRASRAVTVGKCATLTTVLLPSACHCSDISSKFFLLDLSIP